MGILLYSAKIITVIFADDISLMNNIFLLCRLGHYTVPEETDEVCRWLTANLGLEGFRLN